VLHRRQRGQLGRLLPLRDGGRGFPGACALASLPYSPELTLAIASPQDVIDTLLNQAVFIYLGAILPWDALSNAEWNRKALLSTLWHSDTQLITAIAFAVTPWRFVVLGILILLFRRLPFVVGLTKAIPVFATWRESAFSGCVIRFGRFVISVLTCGPCLRCFADGLALSVRNPRLRPPLAPLADAATFFRCLRRCFRRLLHRDGITSAARRRGARPAAQHHRTRLRPFLFWSKASFG
jgi:hypothetical protein